jgi:SpoVK/Ycf46/Vps4 family AAA+-type ATPase
VFLGKPSLEDVDAIVRRQMQRMPCAEGEDIIDVPLLCSRLMYSEPSCADAEALCQKALTAAIREEILRSQEYSEHDSMDDAARRVVHQRHFDAALQELTGWNTVHVEEGAVETEGKPLLNKPFEMELSGTFHF